jgi:hypothetical protein
VQSSSQPNNNQLILLTLKMADLLLEEYNQTEEEG